jgi:hypothetical protein
VQDSENEKLLLEIWNAAFPTEPMHSMVLGNHWKRLGFQGSNPFSDVRAGQLAPLQLHYFASSYPMLMRCITQEAEEFGYPFACSCFNVSQIISIFFGLYEQPAMNPVAGAKHADPLHMNNFARLCADSPKSAETVFNELFCALVQHLHKAWKQKRIDGKSSIMNFSSVLHEVHACNEAFWRSSHSAYEDLQDLATHDYLSSHMHSCTVVSRISSFFNTSIEELLRAMGACILQGLATLEGVVVGRRAKMLTQVDRYASLEAKKYGNYVPPEILQFSACSRKPAWLARPIEGADLDLFFDSHEVGDSIAATAISSKEVVADSFESSIYECRPLQETASQSGPTTKLMPKTSFKTNFSSSTVSNSSIESLDLDGFFREYGSSEGEQGDARKNEPCNSASCLCTPPIDGCINDLDRFLQTCLVVT